jgi:hypothetical protein
LNQIVFKWCSNDPISEELYNLTNEKVGYSRIDNFAVYRIEFKYSTEILKILIAEERNIDIFSEVSKHLRKFKIEKVVYKLMGEEYVNEDLDKFSIFLQHYYNEKGNINIIELT